MLSIKTILLINYTLFINMYHILSMSNMILAESNTDDNWQLRGVNLGGIFVLEPWITPSLFYQFQNRSVQTTAIDSYRFCEVLEGKEANRQLQNHWNTFVTENDLKTLADFGINSIRLPVADWMYVSYYPFTNGCWNNSTFYVDRIIDWCGKYNISVYLDIHTAIGSQNGFDNGGKAGEIFWTNIGEYTKINNPTWLMDNNNSDIIINASNFIPVYNLNSSLPNYNSLNFTSLVIDNIINQYSKNNIVAGILDVTNEPSSSSDQSLNILKEWYQTIDNQINNKAPHWRRIYHDSFKPLSTWEDEKTGLVTQRNMSASSLAALL